ncbi:peptidase [Aureimonas flava]|uniref:Peptidase n=1 Tax=Aureimonas flava TaxID=2320271 RepID=A0A3A1WIY2_9HYPH|nr:prepilin peptidase [Aureimonas flava]RIY00953.1 peptidase [Aureimonas flava]
MAAVLLFAFPIAMVLAAATDLASMTIPNRLVLALALVFPAFALAAGWPLPSVGVHLAAGLAMLCITFGCFAAGWMGGGDAKLLAAAALWLGPTPTLLTFLVWTSVLGGVLTLAFVLARTCLAPTTGVASLDRLLRADTGIPYGVAIAGGGLLSVPALLATLPA